MLPHALFPYTRILLATCLLAGAWITSDAAQANDRTPQSVAQRSADLPEPGGSSAANVASVATLRAGNPAGTTLFLQGYASPGDGGEGTLHYDVADKSADDGGTVFVDAAGHRWRRAGAPRASVKWWGAKGDNVDDTKALVQAWAALEHGTVHELYLPAGTYRMKGAGLGSALILDLSRPGADKASPIAVVGESRERTQIVIDDSITYNRPITFREVRSGLTLRGIHFEDGHVYNGSGRAFNVLDIQNSQNITVEDCWIRGGSFYGLGIYQNTEKGVPPESSDNVVVRGNLFENSGLIGLEIFPKVRSASQTISDNSFINIGGNTEKLKGYTVADSGALKPCQSYKDAKVFRNVIVNPRGGGIYVGNIENCEVYDNVVVNPGTNGTSASAADGIVLSVSPHRQDYSAPFNSTIIRDNYVVWTEPFPQDNTRSGISINGIGLPGGNGPILISNNTIYGTAVGFTMGTVTPNINKVRFTGNTIINTTSIHFISLQNVGPPSGPPTDVEISKNIFRNDDPKRAEFRADLVGARNVRFTDNSIIHPGTRAMYAADSSDVEISGNSIVGSAPNASGSPGLFTIRDKDPSHIYHVRQNQLSNNAGFAKAWVDSSTSAASVCSSGNNDDTHRLAAQGGSVGSACSPQN